MFNRIVFAYATYVNYNVINFLDGFEMKKTTNVRTQLMEDTQHKLISAARIAFAEQGYANTSMDEFTAAVGLTRGAIYHHFGSKKGLFAEVVKQIDAEIDAQLLNISNNAKDPWEGLYQRGKAYLEMVLDPEIQQILLIDAKSVLGSELSKIQMQCIESVEQLLKKGMDNSDIQLTNATTLAVFINGSLTEAAFWIANDEKPQARLPEAIDCWTVLMNGLKIKN